MNTNLSVIDIADDTEAELREARSNMPEPARSDRERFFTVRVPPSPICFEPSECVSIHEDVWEKVLLVESGAKYWAWRHVGTNLVFR